MITKMTTKEVMEIIDDSQSKIEELDEEVATMRSELEKKLAVLAEESEYNSKQLENIKKFSSVENSGTMIIFPNENSVDGIYMTYGSSTHPKWVSFPSNVMNFMTATGPIYKDNAEVTVTTNNESDINVSTGAKNMLMHDAVKGKQPYLYKLNGDEVTLDIKINPSDLLGSTSFNVIEILPYLPGSFDITQIDVYTMLDQKTNSEIPSIVKSTPILETGAMRIFFDDTAPLYRCVIHIKLNYQNKDGKYPFGFKHIYFLNANVNPNSYIVTAVKKDGYINSVSEDIVIRDQDGVRETTCTAEGINIYATNINGELKNEVETSKGIIQNTLARNTKTIYVKIPIKKAISSLKFNKILY